VTVLAGLLLVLALATILWLCSVRVEDASIADIWWGPGFAILAWFYAIRSPVPAWRPIVLAIFVTLWGARLGLHIARRHRGAGEDRRYGAMRARHGTAFWWRSHFTVFWLQGILLWFVALPLFAASRRAAPAGVPWTDIAGVALFAAGFAFETVGDHQLTRFRAVASNRGRVLDSGLWRYTRHPNYFGDALLWWGVYVLSAAVPGAWTMIASPIAMTVLLLRVSGVTLLEAQLTVSKPAYKDYIARTSAFVPWRPRRTAAKLHS